MHLLTVAGLVATALVAAPAPAHRPVASALDHHPISAGADFNLDGHPDVVTGIPLNLDGEGVPSPGAVLVIYGGGLGSLYIEQDGPGVPDTSEDYDHFGESVATWYGPGDEYPDLVVGTPGEDLGDAADAGQVTVFPGGPDGLSLSGYVLNQDSPGMPGAAESGDQFGWSLAGGELGEGFDALAIGSPGEDHHAVDSGSVYVLGDGRVTVLHQDTPGVPGAQEKGDRFGFSLTTHRDVLAVGVPYESLGSVAEAGIVQLFTLRRAGTPVADWPRPRSLLVMDQNRPRVSGVAEKGDRFGWSVSLASEGGGESAPYDLTVGVPYEDLGAVYNAGTVHAFLIDDPYADPSPNWTQRVSINQNSHYVPGVAEEGDRFGSTVDAVTSSYGTVVHTVGSEGEYRDGEVGSPDAIHVFGVPLAGAAWARPGWYGIPSDTSVGTQHVNGGSTHLYVSAARPGMILGVPWGNVLHGEDEPLVEYWE
ncbi:integrin alpha [Phytomonospora endophytica]|uniref:VCBS repeat-containing protein n=1 Tax=Phytomonospora endophytica TaxID=714109 RepID=A0A841FHM2_9ACTN|nr:integrin alpha [Phytomonospora endophytica]MBB6036841.1 hypothetical protein [Phytomonospora endophytica]GIG68125.1 hypothetical protein Pen01_44200 [Phytomonospora endophytica]